MMAKSPCMTCGVHDKAHGRNKCAECWMRAQSIETQAATVKKFIKIEDLQDPAKVQKIIQKFAAKESEFAKARDNYTYRQTVRVLELDEGGNTRGRHEVVADVIFNNDGIYRGVDVNSAGSDPAASKRVFAAMMGMKKIDIAQIEAERPWADKRPGA